jgi:predicted DNA-binding transcriptional regulator YafY
LTPKIEIIQDAIGDRQLVRFQYFSPSGDSERTVEPYYLVFHWSSWYLWGWCRDRKDFRLFKLNRMDGVQKTEEHFVCREAPMPDLSNEKIFPDKIKVRALFDLDQKWRLVEDFGPECFTEHDGKLLFTAEHTDMESLVTWLMTFGDKAEVLEPEEAREAIAQMAKNMVNLNKNE